MKCRRRASSIWLWRRSFCSALVWRTRKRGCGRRLTCSGGGVHRAARDAIDQLFWIDDEGPVAGVVLTDWGSAWGCDLIVVPGVTTVPLSALWRRAVEAIDALGVESVDVLVDNDDAELVDLLASTGFVVGEEDGTTWMDAEERPDVTPLPEGFVLVDRALETTRPHPMRHRNGEQVEARLRQCSLYDPALDLAAETADGQVGGYALFWVRSRDSGWDVGADESRG